VFGAQEPDSSWFFLFWPHHFAGLELCASLKTFRLAVLVFAAWSVDLKPTTVAG